MWWVFMLVVESFKIQGLLFFLVCLKNLAKKLSKKWKKTKEIYFKIFQNFYSRKIHSNPPWFNPNNRIN